jgi:hypothetical protein
MTVAENMALVRRVEKLEREILAVEPKRIRTWFVVCKRGAERRCETIADVHKFAQLDPVVEVIARYPDLDVLIDPRSGARIFGAANDGVYDELAEGVEVLDVEIHCYPQQLRQILSDAKITATTGGTRAGKTRALAWWLFRRWLLDGHGVDDDNDVEAVFWWVREDSGKLYKHAANSGSKAGTSLRSESVAALVCDELSAVHHEENWSEMKSRTAQTGGKIAVAFTPTAGHWSARLAKQAPRSGGAIKGRWRKSGSTSSATRRSPRLSCSRRSCPSQTRSPRPSMS